MRICEIYSSVQGEGLLTGTPSIFIRTSGCNLRCWFCDTPFASWQPEGESLSVEQILGRIEFWNSRHVVVTGGEPLLWRDLPDLCQVMHDQGKHITIETAGTIDRSVQCDLMSISPKLASSAPPEGTSNGWHRRHHHRRHRPELVSRLMARHDYQLKFVVDCRKDAEDVLEYLLELPQLDRDRVLLMPQGTSEPELQQRAEWLIPWCKEHAFRFCERAHIHWFGATRGT